MSSYIKTQACFILSGTSVAQQYREDNVVSITLLKAMHVRQQYKGNALLRFHGSSGYANYITRALPNLFHNLCRKSTKCMQFVPSYICLIASNRISHLITVYNR